MQYEVRRSDTHLEVTLSGVPSIPEVLSMLRDLLQRRHGLKAALVEVKVAMGLDFVGTQFLVEELPRLGFPPDFKFAVLLLDEQARRAADFAQEVAENRGIPIQVFSDRDAALAWLRC
jgi:hypothetical protein